MRRFVLDANILLAALAGSPTAPSALLLSGVHNGDLEAVACPLLLSEFRDGLEKPHFRAALNTSEAHEAIDAYSAVVVMFADPTSVEQVLRDDEDDYLLALARDSDAEAIVTGDKDLLDHPGLHPQAIDARSTWRLIQVGESSGEPTRTRRCHGATRRQPVHPPHSLGARIRPCLDRLQAR